MEFSPPFAPGAFLFLFRLFLFLLSLFPSLAAAGNVVNRTIDDTFGDSQTGQRVTYLPATSGVWQDETCMGCKITPDVTQAFKGTYTAATYNPGLGNINITMQFSGTAIYVFFILANNAGDGITSLTEANFTLDGNAPQLFQHAPDLTTTNIDFNQLVFSQENLLNAQHTLVVSTSGVNTNVYINFDYAIYTHDDTDPLVSLPPPGSTLPTTSGPATSNTPSSTPTGSLAPNASARTPTPSTPSSTPTNSLAPNASAGTPTLTTTTNNASPVQSGSGSDLGSTTATRKSTPTGAIVGGVIGGLAVLAALATLLVLCLRRRRQPHSRESMEAAGYVPPLVTEMSPPMDRPRVATAVNPFTTPLSSQNVLHQYSPPSKVAQTGYGPGPMNYAGPSRGGPASQVDSEVPYGGIASSQASGSASGSGSGLAYVGNNASRGRLISVTTGDHISSPSSDGPLSSTLNSQNPLSLLSPSNKIEATRRARQQELDQRLRTMQQEMAFLASDITGEKSPVGPGGQRNVSVRRRPTSNGTARGESEEGGEELTMAEMREQLRQMRHQISYLREQQQSAWAQGLSDDPPPGYEPGPDSGVPIHPSTVDPS
ncbi:hypothetical protein CPB84DRAFT_1742791 [Gymnopilus junonius]|uniref:Epidermal growth factor receptor-like transmembrane-juxtamembrane segment domain-containing protein n=1 Tax=Gymnopilus junonius TaxID=109634 RepID=A0A9P5NXU9_GYMJU|nr:hypothetical protein CPB84DRAFT_1742791 [Gymnopilus junonius]